jgi:hypothetical protein
VEKTLETHTEETFTIKKIENQFELEVTRDFFFNDHKKRAMEWKGKGKSLLAEKILKSHNIKTRKRRQPQGRMTKEERRKSTA